MMTRLTITLLTVLTVVFAGLYLYEQQRLKGLAGECAALRTHVDAAQLQVAALTATTEVLRTHLQTLSAAHDAAINRAESLKDAVRTTEAMLASNQAERAAETVSATTTVAAPQESKGSIGKQFRESLAALMEQPDMKDTIRAQTKMALVEPIYGGLFKALNLSQEDADALRELITDRHLAAVAPAMKLMQGELSPEDEKALQAEVEKEQSTIDTMIRELLGEDRFAQYERYADTEQERILLSQFNQQAASSGAALSAAQEQALIDAMAALRDRERKAGTWVDLQTTQPRKFNNVMVRKIMDQEQRINAALLDKARTLMSDEQFERFQTFQESQLRMREAQMNMAMKMFQQSEENEQDGR
jgi:hypothetical protein